MAKRVASTRAFPPEDRARALQLLSEGHTLQQVAAEVGCSVASLQKWRSIAKTQKKESTAKSAASMAASAAKPVKRRRKTRRLKKGKSRQKGVVAVLAANPQMEVNEFIQGYWSKCGDAVHVMCLPPDIAPKVMQYVNNALRYAYREFHGK